MPQENEVRRFACLTWEEFVREVARPRGFTTPNGWHFGSGTIYRGHADPKWKLSSRLERNLVMSAPAEAGERELWNFRALNGLQWYDELCGRILDSFRFFAYGQPGYQPSASADELWALGRHHGLLTPLLDWTTSPYVAAFFAFAELFAAYEHGRAVTTSPTGDCVEVWGLQLWDGLQEPDTFEILSLHGFHSQRQKAQAGVFTRLRDREHADLASYLRRRGIAHYLKVYELPVAIGLSALRQLDLMNVNHASLFPDLDGAAVQANLNSDWFRVMLATKEMEGQKSAVQAAADGG